MDDRSVFKEFLEFAKETDENKLNQPMLLTAFNNIDKFLEFSSMTESTRIEIFNHLAGLNVQIQIPSKEFRNNFFNTVKTMLEASEILTSSELPWGGVDPELYDILTDLKIRLAEIHKQEADWKKPGRSSSVSIYQKKGIIRIYELLKNSRLNPNDAEKWRELKIEEFGCFDKRKIFHLKDRYDATPPRLISNFAKGLGVDLSEFTITDLVEKQNS